MNSFLITAFVLTSFLMADHRLLKCYDAEFQIVERSSRLLAPRQEADPAASGHPPQNHLPQARHGRQASNTLQVHTVICMLVARLSVTKCFS